MPALQRWSAVIISITVECYITITVHITLRYGRFGTHYNTLCSHDHFRGSLWTSHKTGMETTRFLYYSQSRPLFRFSSDTGYPFVESSSLPLKSRPLCLWSLTVIALVIIPRPCPRAGKRIGFLPFLSQFFVSVPNGSSFCSTNRTQNVLEFILEATTTTPSFAHARPTQRQVFFVTFSPTCIFSFHH